MDDKKLNEIASRLGAEAENDLDVERVAEGVIDRLRLDGLAYKDQPNPTRWRVWTVRVAGVAAILISVLGVNLFVRGGNAPDRLEVLANGPVMLEELSNDELTSVLDSLTFNAPVSQTHAVGFNDLNEAELQELLAAMED